MLMRSHYQYDLVLGSMNSGSRASFLRFRSACHRSNQAFILALWAPPGFISPLAIGRRKKRERSP